MKLAPKHVFARFTARITGTRPARRRSLKFVPPVSSECILESRVLLDGSGMDNMPPTLTVTVDPIPDTAVNGDAVGYATATDVDGDNVTFSFDGGSQTDPSGTFEIDANTGIITVANADNIGSQNGDLDGPTGWSFVGTIVASDGPVSPGDTSETVAFVVDKSPFQIARPTPDQVFVATTDDVIFRGTRPKGVTVQVEIFMKDSDGVYQKITNPNFTSILQQSGPGNDVNLNFHKAIPGEYLMEYKFKQGEGFTDTGERVYFSAVVP